MFLQQRSHERTNSAGCHKTGSWLHIVVDHQCPTMLKPIGLLLGFQPRRNMLHSCLSCSCLPANDQNFWRCSTTATSHVVVEVLRATGTPWHRDRARQDTLLNQTPTPHLQDPQVTLRCVLVPHQSSTGGTTTETRKNFQKNSRLVLRMPTHRTKCYRACYASISL